MLEETVDVLVIGAGISGIGAACHLKRHCPGRSMAMLEARDDLGGTWDLFRYPGIRSDSDMYTLGFSFKPWKQAKSIADGSTIQSYLRETVAEHGLQAHIRYGHRMLRADWVSADAQWHVQVLRKSDGQTMLFHCNFLFMCSGYYRYEAGHMPAFPGAARFQGPLIHPQHWPQGLDLTGKRVVVIGSGATAVTLVPELAKQAAQVTMLQRTPTYMVARPSVDGIAMRLRAWFPERLAYALTRAKNVLLGMWVFRLCRRRPQQVKRYFIGEAAKAMGPQVDVAKHFTPPYNPWEQRLCLVPDGDLFATVREGRAMVVTDHIDTFTETGITLRSGQHLPADVVVAATGLHLQMLGGAVLTVDGQAVDPAKTVSYKGVMYSGIPNMAATFGYTNASWTLKADLTSRYVCRLLKHMAATGARECVPRAPDAGVGLRPWVDFSSGYFQRSLAQLPQQGAKAPWKLNQNYLVDALALRFGRMDDGVLEFSA